MIQSIIHTSENNNLYLYDDQRRLSTLVHPEFEKVYEQLIDVNPYYLRKYVYLKDHGFFAKPKIADFRTLEESVVRDNIINVKQIVFEATDSCNLNCTYCSLGELYDISDKINKKINTPYAIKLLKYIFGLKPKNRNSKLFVSFYGGEALLNINFIKRIVDVANQLNAEKELELEFSMTTNTTLILKYISFLAANKFRLLVSLDGNEANHSYRVFSKNNKNSFQKVIENLDVIQRDYPEYFSFYVNFNAVLHNRNSVKEIYEFIYTRYHKIPRISELNMRDINSAHKDMLGKMFHSKIKSEAEYQKEESDLTRITHDKSLSYTDLVNFLKNVSINYYISNINALLYIEEKYLPTGTCTPFSKKIFLTNRNKLLPCEKINYKYSMGKVNKEVEIDIPKITRQYNSYFEHLKKVCQYCYSYKFCEACLFQIDNVNTEEFVCNQFKDQKTFKNKLHRIFSFLEKYPNDFSEILENVILE
ncbi:radical SAM peptide maturase [Bacteroidia bacterium]|nr:radical SAM peptide maturase [Bacteroidia bacterium]GHT85130.1 radical SAM peptide maturase [Bacteroidia bacterium]